MRNEEQLVRVILAICIGLISIPALLVVASGEQHQLATESTESVGAVQTRLTEKALRTNGRVVARVPALSVTDSIGLTTISDGSIISPDHAHVAVVIQHGNLERNTVDYSLLVFRTADLLTSPKPATIAEFASSSNGPGISQVRWLSEYVLAFLGERPHMLPQVYTADIRTLKVSQRTRATTKIKAYEAWEKGEKICYVADAPTQDDAAFTLMRARGFAVDETRLEALLSQNWRKYTGTHANPVIHMIRDGSETRVQLQDVPALWEEDDWAAALSVRPGPSGDKALILFRTKTVPIWWSGYRDTLLKWSFDHYNVDSVPIWMVVDLRTGQSHPLTGAPISTDSSFMSQIPFWSDDHSVFFPGAVLPLDTANLGPAERSLRAKQLMTAEIDVRTGALHVIARKQLGIVNWDPRGFVTAKEQCSKCDSAPIEYYRKTVSGWVEVSAAKMPAKMLVPAMKVEQGPNEPWKLIVVDPRTQGKHLVYDPNPGLAEKRRLARVTSIQWRSEAGVPWGGMLYWPVDYSEGTRYPLVIQTHGKRSDEFAPDGFSTTGYAAQALAGSGIFVLQIGYASQKFAEKNELDKKPEREGAYQQEGVEGAIDHLDGLGLIDRAKIGMQGFSLTSYYVLYFLVHSNYLLASATVADGIDYGYVQYLFFAHGRSEEDYHAHNGGAPFGPPLISWLDRAPGFNLDRIRTPLQLTALGHGETSGLVGLLQEWEPFAGLLAQGKPAELVYIPDGAHELVKPWERFTSQQNCTVDWYRFWLQGYERSAPVAEAGETKEDLKGQYARWHKLRDTRDANAGKAKSKSSRETSPTNK